MPPGPSAFASTSSTPFRCAVAYLRTASSPGSRAFASEAPARQRSTPAPAPDAPSTSSLPFHRFGEAPPRLRPRPPPSLPPPPQADPNPPLPAPLPKPSFTAEDCNRQLARLIKRHLEALPPNPLVPPPFRSARPPQNVLADGLAIAARMAAASVQPTGHTYDLLIQCCLVAQENRLAALPDGVLHRPPVHEAEAGVIEGVKAELNWLEKRRRLFLPWKLDNNQTGVWFGSAEWEIGWGLFLDSNRAGVRLSRSGLDNLMKLAHIHPTLAIRVASLLTQPSFAPSPDSFEISLLTYLHIPTSTTVPFDPSADLDRILSIYADARSYGQFPTAETVNQIAARLVAVDYSNAAVDMLVDYEANSGSPVGFSPSVWASIMRGICRKKHAAALVTAWEHSVDTGKLDPDVGLTLDALFIAASSGLPEFAISLTELLKAKGLPLAEEHLGPVVHAWCTVGDLEAAMHSLAVMRAEGVPPTMDTARPVVELVMGRKGAVDPEDIEAVASVTESVDKAWFTLVESKERRGIVDVAAANAIMLACLGVLDFVRCAETFEELSSLGISPDIDTYNILLDACLLRPDETLPLFERILSTLSSFPFLSSQTHERIIAFLCTQPFDAFSPAALTHLADSRLTSEGATRRSYDLTVRRLAQEGDERTMTLVDEMVQQGYPMQSELRACLNDCGYRDALEELLGERSTRGRGMASLRKPLEEHGRSDWYAGRVAPHLVDR